MAALEEGRQYGLSSSTSLQDQRSLVQVKLTDSALRSIDEFLRHKNKSGPRPSIQFSGNNGVITIPSQSSGTRTFQFSTSAVADSNTSDCIQQPDTKYGSHLNLLGTMSQKMTIHASSDVFQATRQKMTQAIEDANSVCTQQIKLSGQRISRKIKKVKPGLDIVSKSRESSAIIKSAKSSVPSGFTPSSNTHRQAPPLPANHSSNHTHNSSPYQGSHVSSTTSKLSSSSLSSVSSSLSTSASLPTSSSSCSNVRQSNSAIMSMPIRERIIHLLAVRPYKIPELLLRLKKDGILDKDKDQITSVLQQVAWFNTRDNKYSLAKHAISDVKQDWRFYSDIDKELVKKKLENLSPASSPASSHQSPESPSSSQQKRPSESAVDSYLPSKKPRISHSIAKPKKENKPVMADIQRNDVHSTLLNGHDRKHKKENIDDSVEIATSTSDTPEYVNKYHPISSAEQRQKYKCDFNQEYEEYRDLHKNVEKVSRRFAELESRMKKSEPGSETYENLKNKIRSEYKQQKGDPKYIEQKKRFDHLHKKLSHIKQLILEYDKSQTAMDS